MRIGPRIDEQFDPSAASTGTSQANRPGLPLIAGQDHVSKWEPRRQCVAVHNNQLYVAGFLVPVSGPRFGAVLRWTGTSWQTVGTATVFGSFAVPTVYALASYAGQLVAGGEFSVMSGVTLPGIARWNGTTWSGLSTGMGGGGVPTVYALAPYGTALVAGGAFASAGGVSAANVGSWDGTQWSAFGQGIQSAAATPVVRAVVTYRDSLVVAGTFTAADSVPAANIARWNGARWSSLGSGTGACTGDALRGDPTVAAVSVWGTGLFAGGVFSFAGARPAAGLAHWDDTLVTGIALFAGPEIPGLSGLHVLTATSGTVRLAYRLPQAGRTRLDILSVTGRWVATVWNGAQQAGPQQVEWQPRDARATRPAAGVYWAVLHAATGVRSAARFVVLP